MILAGQDGKVPTVSSADAPLVLAEKRGVVGLLTINRPHARNAISREVTIAMAAGVDVMESDEDVRVLVITGAGDDAFCAGADLKAPAQNRPTVEELGGFAAITSRSFAKPVIAAVNGVALGGGTEICLACDLIVAEEHASFGLPEVRRGIVAAAGGLERLPHHVPPAVAMEMILTGEPIRADRALALGLVNRVVARGRAVPAAIGLARTIALGAPMAIGYSCAVARASISAGEREAIVGLADLYDRIIASDDRREGARAFAEKRTPRWTGS